MKTVRTLPDTFANALVRRYSYLDGILRTSTQSVRPGISYDRVERDALAFVLAMVGVDADAAADAARRGRDAADGQRRARGARVPSEPGGSRYVPGGF